MQMISNYHRPSNLDEALALVGRNDVNTVVVAGGTVVSASELPAPTEVVDVQQVAPATIERRGDRVIFGAMARLQAVIDNEATPPLITALAKREGPNTLRNASTIGGTVAEANAESELLAGLLVHDAIVTVAKPAGVIEVSLPELLADRTVVAGGIITAVSVAIGGETASARTGRTPADTSIVAAAGRIVAAGLKVAVTGVAVTPILVDPDNLADLNPPADFRGTAEYRIELAQVLTARVVDQLGGAA